MTLVDGMAARLVAVGLLALPGVAAVAAEIACAAPERTGLASGVTVSSAKLVAAEGARPRFCEISVTIAPVQGSNIRAVYRLPERWNGNVLGLGGGGWAGNVSLTSATPGLMRGYATLQTDTGHPITPSFDTRWAIDAGGKPNMVAIEDFGHRAVHEMTRVGKQIVSTYYGRPHARAYWQGCSTGGRQGFMEVQRYPQDYDGVIAGAPVYDLITTTGALLRYNNFVAPERRLASSHLDLVNKAVLKSCDARDGAADGIVIDPRACDWDPGELACESNAATDRCLTAGQIDAVRVAYRGVRMKSGAIAAYPLSRGSELGWTRFHSPSGAAPGDAASVGMSGLRPAFFADADFDLTRFDADRDVPRVRGSELAKTYEATDPDLSTFVARGGNLIIWHGLYDPGPGPLGTIEYYERVLRETKAPDVAQAVRLFLAPGVAHCGGGPGPDQIDFLGALERWVEQGEAPESVIATKKDSTLSWPVCAYPAMTQGRSGGDGYECKPSR